MARIGGLGLGPDSPCYDPNHPWYLPDFLHTNYECNCLVANPQPGQESCVFGYNVGTPATYTKPADVPSVTDVVLQTPGAVVGYTANVAGQAIGAAAKGAASTVDFSGALIIAGLATAAFFIYKR